MSDVADQVARSGDLKQELVAFAQRPRFARAFRAVLGGPQNLFVGDEDELIEKFDAFVLRHRLGDGRTVIDHFVSARPDLSDLDREMLLGWRDPVEGMFEVKRRDGNAVLLLNLIDELTYRVYSNAGDASGTATLAPMTRRSFLVTRLVPVGQDWVFSGCQHLLPSSARPEVAQVVATMSMQRPELAFRNPEKLKAAWAMQREDRAHFIEFFGTDLVVVPGSQMAERMQSYWEYHNRLLTGDSRTAAPKMEWSADVTESESVGLIYDEVEGLSFFTDFAVVVEAFARPELVTSQPYRRTVQGYLRDDTVSPLPFRRLAGRDPDKASRLFQLLLKRPTFSWQADGETLLRRRKAAYFDNPPLPKFVPTSAIALEHYRPQASRRSA